MAFIPIWMLISIFGAAMQAIRTAAQKRLSTALVKDQTNQSEEPLKNNPLTVVGATYVRSLLGLPFALLYLWFILQFSNSEPRGLLWGWQHINQAGFSLRFQALAFAGGLAQILATVLLVQSFKLRSFVVATAFSKSHLLWVAVLGTAFFAQPLSLIGWILILAVSFGMVLMTVARIDHRPKGAPSLKGFLFNPSLLYGLGAGLFFALAGLFVSAANQVLNTGLFVLDAAWTLCIVLVWQIVLVGLYCFFREPGVYSQIFGRLQLGLFVGLTSVLGSLAWFTAFSLTKVSYVVAVAQIEMLFVYLITRLFFKEEIRKLELIGIVFLVLGLVFMPFA